MGCWNMTCAISNLPINRDDKVVAFVIEGESDKMPLGLGFTEPDLYFKPVTMPYFGIYNESGSLRDYKTNFEKMDIHLKERADKNYQCYDREFVSKELNISDINMRELFDYIARGAIMCKGSGFDTEMKPVGMVFFKQSVLDKLIEDLKKEDDYKIELVEERYDECIEILIKEREEYLNRFKESEISYASFRASVLWRLSGRNSALKDFVIRLVYEGDVKLSSIKESVMYMGYINVLMQRLRKSWMPQCGIGSQEYTNSSYSVLGEIMASEYEKEREEY